MACKLIPSLNHCEIMVIGMICPLGSLIDGRRRESGVGRTFVASIRPRIGFCLVMPSLATPLIWQTVYHKRRQ
jgi:hypothetical protein